MSRAISALCFVLIGGCTTFTAIPIDENLFRARAQVRVDENVRATAAVVSAEECEQVFGLDLYGRGIQPVWLEIENRDPLPMRFLPVGLDPDYFAPLEVSFIHRFRFAKEANEAMDRYLNSRSRLPVQVTACIHDFSATSSLSMRRLICS